MAQKKKVTARVVGQRRLAEGIYDLSLETPLAFEAVCGQFVGVYPKDKSTLLPRPISICETDRERGLLRLVYRVAGKGTAEFSGLKAGDTAELLGVLGNGFPTDKAKPGMTALLFGGGIGVPPILQLAKELSCEKLIVPGYRDSQCFLMEDFEKYGAVYPATEDGSVGTKGNVLDAVRQNGLRADIIYACGPMPMLRAVKQYALEQDIPAYISLEERMACGVGACLGCVCRTAKKDPHSHVNNARICTDGPVFEAREVEIG
ncbi:MAG: dihydroorotate dehydrogenase electron transfer subunit [Eubacteriales bacterium]|nr:dihydroorotate dehydrogenase electron transfer subunit [Eubacteriales bacterium]